MKTRRALITGLAVSAVTALLFLPAWPGAFHFDDFHSVVDNVALDGAAVGEIFSNPALFSGLPAPMYRPLTVLSFALQAHGGQLRPGPLAAVNIALHAVSVGLIFGIALLLSGSRKKALPAALIFAVHPVQTQAVNYISCRSTLLAGSLALAAILFFLLSRKKRGPAGKILGLASPLIFFAALLAKSEVFTAALIPGLILVFAGSGTGDPEDSASSPDNSRAAGLAAAGFIAAAGVYLLLRWWMGVDVIMPAKPIRGVPANLATGARAALQYLLLIIRPGGLSVIHDLVPSTSFLDYRALISAAVYVALPAAAFTARKKRPLFILGLAWFVIGLLPTHTLVPLHAVMAEHRIYFSMAGLALAGSELLFGLAFAAEDTGSGAGAACRKKIAVACVIMIALSWIALTERRNRDWQSEPRLWETAVSRAPTSATAWVNLGVAWWEDNRVSDSGRAFEAALIFDPVNLAAMMNLGRIYVDEGRLDDGIRVMEFVITRAPSEPQAHYNLARAYALAGRYLLAEMHYREALKIMPGHLRACEGLAELYVHQLSDADKARRIIPRCLAMRPSPDEVMRMKVLLQHLNDLEHGLGNRPAE